MPSLPFSVAPVVTAFNAPPIAVGPVGDVAQIGFVTTALGPALNVALVGAPVVVVVDLDLIDDEVAIGGPDAADVRRLFRGVTDGGGRNVIETVPGLLGAQALALGKVEDTAQVAADVGVPAYAVRNDVPGTLVDTDADYSALQVDATGQLRIGGAAPTGLGKAEDTAQVAADVGVPAYAVRNDVEGTLVDTDADYSAVQVDAVGSVRVRTSTGVTGTTVQTVPTAGGDNAVLAANAARRMLGILNTGNRVIEIYLAAVAGLAGTGIPIPTAGAGQFQPLELPYQGVISTRAIGAGGGPALAIWEVND